MEKKTDTFSFPPLNTFLLSIKFVLIMQISIKSSAISITQFKYRISRSTKQLESCLAKPKVKSYLEISKIFARSYSKNVEILTNKVHNKEKTAWQKCKVLATFEPIAPCTKSQFHNH